LFALLFALLAYSFHLNYSELTSLEQSLCYIIGEFGLKFKFVFILFSLTMLLLFLIFIFVPLLLLGPSFSLSYWLANWPLLLLWLLLFAAFSFFFFTNRRLFFLLEREDWPALVHYLEYEVFTKGRYSSRLVRLLATSYLVLSDTDGVLNLENKASIAKPASVNQNALIFGAARILGKDFSGAARFFEARKYTAKPVLREWVSWYLGFSFLLDYRLEGAADEFSVLARQSKNAVVTALSSFFLSETLSRVLPEKEAELLKVSSVGKNRALRILPDIESWTRAIDKISTEIHLAVISKYIEGTGRWLYQVKSEE
jgi:hypothetical protein